MPEQGHVTPPAPTVAEADGYGLLHAAAYSFLRDHPGHRDRLRAGMAVDRRSTVPDDDPIVRRWLELAQAALAAEAGDLP